MRRLERVKTDKNSLLYWTRFQNPLYAAINYFIVWLCKWLPSLRLKRGLLRAVGVKIGKDVSIAAGANIDFFFPELLEIGDNTIIGYNTAILCHEFLAREFRKGRVRIGKNVMIGINCTILAGVSIGDNAVVSAMSLVNHDIPANSFYGGVPAKKIR